MKKVVLLILASAAVVSCSDGGSGSSQIEGDDLTGSYGLAGLECYNPNTVVLSDVAIFSGSTERIIITGNSLISESTSGGCSSTSSGKVVFRANNVMDLSDISYSSVTGGNCTATRNVASSPANHITPTSSSTVLYTGKTVPNSQANWIKNSNTGAIGVLSIYKTTDNSDLCFLIYLKN